MTDGEKILQAIREIVGRGNTAEVRKTKDGILVFEIKRKQVTGK